MNEDIKKTLFSNRVRYLDITHLNLQEDLLMEKINNTAD